MMLARVFKYAAIAFALLASGQAHGQTLPKYALLAADFVTYTTGYQTLRASGNVEIIFGDINLKATSLEYDQQNDFITVTGPLVLKDGDTLTFVADYAKLSTDLQEGILTGARMVLDQQLQIAANEIKRVQGRYIQLTKAAVSSCTVSILRPVPLWQIRSKQVVHDQEKKQLTFEGAQFLVGNVPIIYLPRLRLPDPSVKRLTGFLVPRYQISSTLGTGILIPYFITIGDHADITLTPMITTTNSRTLQFAYRQRFHNGALNFDGAVSSDRLTSAPYRAYFFGDASFTFANGTQAKFKTQLVSDRSYLTQYDISSLGRMHSNISVFRVQRQSLFATDISGYHSLSSAVSNATIPFLLGDIYLRKRWSPAAIGGQIGLTAQANALFRRSTTDGAAGRDVARTSAAVDWTRQWIRPGGLVINATGVLRTDHYNVFDDSAFAAPITRASGVGAVTFSLPLAKRTAKATHILQPTAQVIWSPASSTTVPNEDSVQVNFENTNLFSLNRFSGTDMIEAGLRANLGVAYSRYSGNGWIIGASVGQVFRTAATGQFGVLTGLSGVRSGTVSTMSFYLPTKFKLENRMVTGSGLSLLKNETRLRFKTKKIDVSTAFTWLAMGAASNPTANRSELAIDAFFDLRRNWSGSASFQYDVVAAAPENAEVTLTYSNECIKVDLSLSRRFVSSTNVTPSTGVGLTVELAGFGSVREDARKRRCVNF